MVSSGASQKIFEAAKEITDLYEYVLDVHRDLIFADQIDFASLGNMPKSLAKLIIIKFVKAKISGYKLKKTLADALYVALLRGSDKELNVDKESSVVVKGWNPSS